MKNKNQTNKAVGYCRCNYKSQSEESIGYQKELINKFAQKKGYEIVEWYMDNSAGSRIDTAIRPEFKRMLSDAEKKKFNCIIVSQLDRFSRDSFDAVYYKNKLGEFGITLLSATEQPGNSPESKLWETVIKAMMEYKRQNNQPEEP